MLPLKPIKFQNPIRKWHDTQNGKRKWKGILKSLQLGWEVVVVDYCPILNKYLILSKAVL